MGICTYEEVSEGAPISPIYPDTPEGRQQLLIYLTENQPIWGNRKTGVEGWTMALFGNALFNPKENSVEGHISSSQKKLNSHYSSNTLL
jgi:hypothetical protein